MALLKLFKEEMWYIQITGFRQYDNVWTKVSGTIERKDENVSKRVGNECGRNGQGEKDTTDKWKGWEKNMGERREEVNKCKEGVKKVKEVDVKEI